MLINKKTLGWAFIALLSLISCSRRDILTDAAPTTTTQQAPAETGQDKDTPLHQAILAQTDLASLYPFLQPTSINQPDNEGNTPLHRAVIQDNLPLVGLLLSAKATIDAQNAAGLAPLHLAAKQGNLLTLHLLLIYHGNIHAKDKEGRTPLDYIKEKKHTDQLQQILQRTPWDAIASERDPFVVAWLLAAEKNRTKNTQGWTPLHLAACLGQVKAMQDLIANKADIEAKNAQGWTPLHLAAFLGQPEAVQLLIDHQASTEAIDHKGRTPYDIAGSAAVKELLGSRMNLTKLVFHTDYENIGKRILDNLASEDNKQWQPLRTLRETSPKMGWELLKKERVVLQVTLDKLPDLQPHRYVGLYPHVQTPHCVCPTFDPIPADAVVRSAFDLEQIAKSKHLLIKNVVFKGGVATLEPLRAALPTHLIDHLIVPVEILTKEAEKLARKKEREAAKEASLLSDSPAEEEEPIYLSEEEPSEDPYSSSTLQELEPPHEETFSNLYGGAGNPYRSASQPADETKYTEEDMESSASAEQGYSSDEEEKQADQAAGSDQEQQPHVNQNETADQGKAIVDPGNQLYNSFVGVKKLPAGKITIEKYLAAGAFGKVYRGQWGDKRVALKQIDLNHAATKIGIDREEVKEAMQWEVTRLSTVSHPNLVQFYGLYQDGEEGYTYMVMEFCDGGTMQDALKKDIRWAQRWQWALQISQALSYLHEEGTLHRDLKAENILLDRNGTAKLADLGVAQVDALLQEAEANVVATGLQDKRFIAPEVENDPTLSTKATDIYALGLVFWQIATGKEPRKIEGLDNYRKDDWRGGREREEIPKDCPESFKALILECWAQEASQRPIAQDVLVKLAALGPELDPYHHPLVTAAQKLEQLVHPKRKEGLAYVPPFVTQYSVDESIEMYWNRIEAAKKKGETVPNAPLILEKTFEEFIETPNANTLLLLGEAGLGKTLTTYQWGDQLLKQWWAHINTGTPAPAYFPLFIRPEMSTWSHAGIKGAFQEVARKYNLPKGIQLIVFIDGYDELQNDAEPTNLVDHLGLLGMGNTKLIVTCRPNTVKQSAQKSRFGFNGALTTRHFLPFNLDQLLGYLKNELSWEEKVYQDYKNTLGNAEGVRTVLRNPFVLHLFRESWATLSQKPLAALNRWQIYEGFIEHSIKTGKTLLPKKVQKRLKDNYPNLLTSYQAFMSTVAGQAFQQKAITLGVEEAKGISPWADLPRYVEEVAKDEFAERTKKLQAAIDDAPEEKKTQLSRRSLLTEGDFVSLNQKRIGQAEAELPLKRRGEQYEYSHKSLFEYGMAKRLLLLQHSPNIVEEGIKLLNSRKLQEEPEVLQFWQEGWKVPSSEEMTGSKALIEPFFDLIIRSREEEAIQQASANSATLLAQAQVAFTGRALQGVRLPGADLSGTVLSHTSLAGAQLPGALLRDAYFGNADLRDADLSGVDFGQYPSLKCKKKVHCLSYNRAGTQLAVGLGKGDIELYNQAEGSYTPLATLKGHTDMVFSVTYRPDGQQLASGSKDNTVGLWDPASQQLLAQLKGHSDIVRSVTYRPDGQQLASGSSDHTVCLWNPHSQQLLAQLKGHSGGVSSVCYSPDGQQLASGSDFTVYLWDPASQQLLAQLKGHSYWVGSVCYRPDGLQLASGSSDKTVGLWDPASQQLLSQLKGHSSYVTNVCYRPDGLQLASGNEDKTVGLWDPNSQQLLAQLKGHSSWVRSVCYHPDGQQLASGSYDDTIGLWDPHSQQLLAQLKGHRSWVYSISYRPDGQQLASGSGDSTVGLWDPRSHQLQTLLKGHSGIVFSVCYRPDGQQLASGSEDKTVCLWDPASKLLLAQLKGHSRGVMSVCYRPDGLQLASGGKDNTVGLWDPASQQLLAQLKGHSHVINSVCYRPDGKQLASGSDDKTVGLWDPHSHQLQTLLKGHSGEVNSVCYRPDGQQLASGSNDKTVGLWDPARSQQLLAQLKGHSGRVWSVRYRPDGQQLASGSEDQAIFVWAKQDIAGSLQEIWQLIHRFENTASLSAPGAWLKGANISVSNRTLLEQKGAIGGGNDDQDLHNAIQHGHPWIFQTLLQSKANIEATTQGGTRPLHTAATYGRTEALQTLLESKANIEGKDENDLAPLHMAAENGHIQTMKALINSRANIDAKNKEGQTPLHRAVQKGQVSATYALLQANASIDKKMIDDNVFLNKAVQEYHTEAIQLLLEVAPTIDAANEYGLTPLHIAAKNGYTRGVEVLVQARANIEAIDKEGRTPLHFAAQNGHKGAIEALLQAGANIEAGQKDGLTPLHFASQNGDRGAVEALLQARANIDATNKDSLTPLHLAAQNGSKETVEALLQARANIEATEKEGRTPLHFAAKNGHTKAVEALLQARANIDATDKEGWTPLHFAAQNGSKETVEALIQARANIEAADKDGKRPLHIAAALKPSWRGKPIEVIQALLQAGANIEATEGNGCTPLHIAAALKPDQGREEAKQKKSQIEVVQYLLSQGANKDVINNEGKKPYDLVGDGQVELKTLLSSGE